MGMTPTIDVLLDARALLARTDGWIQHSRRQMVNGKVAYCIEGALEAAEQPKSQRCFSEAWARVQGVLDEAIPMYNDAPERQQSEVVETIDRAIQAEWRGDPIPSVQRVEALPEFADLVQGIPFVFPPDAA
jgi:hypothetical protein